MNRPAVFIKRILLLFFLIPLASAALQQDSIPEARLKLQHLTIDDGLSQGMVTTITQDKHGFMWFGTKDGLNKYDGYKFKTYRHDISDSTSLADNYIYIIFADSRGLIWTVFVDGAVDVFNPETETAYHLTAESPELKIHSMGTTRFMEKNDGTVFFTDMDKYVKAEVTAAEENSRFGYTIKTQDLSSHLPASSLGSRNLLAFISSSGKLYLSFNDSILVYSDADISKKVNVTRFHQSKFPEAMQPERMPAQPSDETVNVFSEDTVHHTLLSMGKKSFTRFNDRTGLMTERVELEKLFHDIFVTTVLIDNNGTAWLLTGGGIYLYNIRKKELKQLQAQNASIKKEVFHYVSSFFKDRSGVIWIGTSGFGLIKYNSNAERFHHVEGNGDGNFSIQGLWEDYNHKGIWLRRNEAVMSLYKRSTGRITETFSPFVKKESASKLSADGKLFGSAFCIDNKGYWLTDANFIFCLNRDLNILHRFTPQKVPENNVGVSTMDSKGNVWMATGLGRKFVLHMLNENSDRELKSYWFPKQETTAWFPFSSAIVPDAMDNLWIATIEGLYVFNPEKETWTHFENQKNDTSSLPMNTLYSLCNDAVLKNILWIGTNGGGLVKFDRNTGKCKTYTTKDGLPNDVIYGILTDRKGNLWMSTNSGIARFNPSSKEIKIFTEKDGLQSNEFNRYAYCKLQSGEMVFGGVNGFNIFNPDEINENPFQPAILFTGFKIGNKEVQMNSDDKLLTKNIYATKEIHLNHTQNFITFSFASADYSASDNITYQYRLEGLDHDWLPATGLNEATYTNLNPGDYTFKVRGTNSDGVWSRNEAAIFIFISPPWWGTWWFRTLVVLMVAAAIYSFYRYRLTQAVKLMSLRNRIASDLHDEIGSTLSSISLYSAAAKKMLGGNEQADKVLTKINSNTSEMMEAMSDIIWAINTRNDKLDNLVNRMRSFAVQASEAKNFELHLAENEKMPDMPLDMYERKNLYLIFKESVNNAAKYSECKNLWIDFSNKNQVLEMSIKDDGKGFEIITVDNSGTSAFRNKNETGGNGLPNMKKRANDLRGELTINSGRGKGTEILLKMKLMSGRKNHMNS